jgi:predicted nucleic acid-binding protein
MSFLVDTNVLIRSLSPAHTDFAMADGAIAKLRTQGVKLHLVAQNLYEYWVVATRPTADNGFGLTAQETTTELKRLHSLYVVLADTPVVLDEWESLVTSLGVMGKNAHDARLVAAMKVHGISDLLTFNIKDFQRYNGIGVQTPQDVMAKP